jgi:hypothetical protein
MMKAIYIDKFVNVYFSEDDFNKYASLTNAK